MLVAVTGASGLIGSALAKDLRADGHRVIELVRREPETTDQVRWDPATGELDIDQLAGVEAIVHLAGAGVGDQRWSDSYKDVIRASRVTGTDTIARATAQLSPPPKVLVSGSAMGYYGDRGDEAVDETASKGFGFLADVVTDWEAAANPARDAGIRVVHPRTGLVFSQNGGAFERMHTLFKFGLGGRLGSGTQYWSFISLRDEVRALRFMIDNASLSGPVNVVAPNPVTNTEVTKSMAKQLHRPSMFPAPAFALKLVLGEFSIEVLSSTRVVPAKLQAAGFGWLDPNIDDAIKAALES